MFSISLKNINSGEGRFLAKKPSLVADISIMNQKYFYIGFDRDGKFNGEKIQ